MEEKKFIKVRKEEYNLKEFIKKSFGKGKISSISIEYTPVGEKIVIRTHKPGIVIGKKGERLEELTNIMKRKFKMENPYINIEEIIKPQLDPRIVADDIALALERFGALRFKAICYRALKMIKDAKAQGAEIRVSGKLPSDRAKSWRFAFGYLKKTGDASNAVKKALSIAETRKGVVGIKVFILTPDTKMPDQIDVDESLLEEINKNGFEEVEEVKEGKKGKKK